MLNTVIMTSIANAKCSFRGNPSLKPSLIDHAKELPTITGDMALCDKKRTEKVREYYLSHPKRETRKYITKFRLSDHKLLIETGRYTNIPREERKCKVCNLVEDEIHFFFNCKSNENVRKILIQHLVNLDKNFENLNFFEKLEKILNPSTPKDIDIVVSFIKLEL